MSNKIKGRIVAISKEFLVPGTFKSMYAAQAWLKQNGYDYGSTSAMDPTPVVKGEYGNYDLPQKWKNFTRADELTVHGAITGNMRDGPVTVHIFQEKQPNNPPENMSKISTQNV
ncbi:hypothetical protein [Paraflavitalea sp. CAU 1676]|uniref:hypothetical protein n=1 Tax=Paraflavitalea sp. CAU 1676 TaxID=3032598 RepID=UPI0023DA67A8|nr:hypothetical protein [Paraflavitalea sp. CAU 1676]MDF2189303.1 hypothetical protein [Paraflavitalea sp. CAU 1676]